MSSLSGPLFPSKINRKYLKILSHFSTENIKQKPFCHSNYVIKINVQDKLNKVLNESKNNKQIPKVIFLRPKIMILGDFKPHQIFRFIGSLVGIYEKKIPAILFINHSKKILQKDSFD